MNKPIDVAEPREPLCDKPGSIPEFPLAADDSTARRDAVLRAIDAIAQITDESDTEELWIEGMKDIDAHRPHRKLFEGMR